MTCLPPIANIGYTKNTRTMGQHSAVSAPARYREHDSNKITLNIEKITLAEVGERAQQPAPHYYYYSSAVDLTHDS